VSICQADVQPSSVVGERHIGLNYRLNDLSAVKGVRRNGPRSTLLDERMLVA